MLTGPANFIRSIALATVLGMLATLWTNQLKWGSVLAAWREPSEIDGTNRAIGDWPICSSSSMPGSEVDWAELDPDLVAGKRALAKREWMNAITALNFTVMRDPRNADLYNYLGYAFLRAGQLGPAMGNFQQALLINPRHRGAREHLGELYLALNEPARAEEQLTELRQICLIPCEEFGALQRSIAASSSSSRR